MSTGVEEQSANYNLADLKPTLEKATGDNILLNSLPIWLSAQTTKSAGRGRSAENTHQYGVQKLRELILELAVRGKLVEQDPNDEPASMLLEKIAEEKSLLAQKGKFKKQQTLKAVTEDEVPFSLPQGWELTRLGEVISVINGRAYKRNEMLDSGTPLLRVGNLFTSNDWYYSDLQLEPEKYINDGDLIYAWSASFGPFIWHGGKVIYHYHIWKLDMYRPDLLDKYFIYHFLASVTEQIKASGNGIAMLHMTKQGMEKLPLPVPPLAEQHRIVKKVDALMALCNQLEQKQTDAVQAHDTLVNVLLDSLSQSDNAEDFQQNWRRIAEHFDTLFTTESSIDQLKQTLLQLAVMGKLVPQDPNDEPASVLLEKIAQEKARLVKEGKIRKQKPLPEIIDDEKTYALPENWAWTRFGDVFTLEYGNNLPQSKRTNTGEYRVYGSNGVVGSHESCCVKQPCIVIGRKGSAGALNLCKDDGCWVTDVAYSSVPPQDIDLAFAFKLFHTLGLDNLGKGIKPGLNRNEAYILPVALPPLAEQHRIVKKVDELMTLFDQLKDRLNQAQTLQKQLADTVVGVTIS